MIRPMLVEMVHQSTSGIWAVVAACIALLTVFLLAIYKICKPFFKGADMFRHWPFYLSAVVGLILLLRFGVTMTAVKGMILTLILLYASMSDFKKREVPDWIWVMILILSFVNFQSDHLSSMITGAVVAFIPQLATNMINPGRPIGGADIKISTAMAFLLGAWKGIFALVVGLLLAIVTTAVTNKVKNQDQKASFPLVPYLWIGATIAYLI